MNSADDIEAIRKLTHRYFWGWDADDVEAVVSVFAPDAVHDERNMSTSIACGHEEIRALFTRLRPGIEQCFHLVGNHIVDFDDENRAHGTNYFSAEVIVEGALVRARGYFEDTYRRDEHGWRIATRVVYPLLSLPSE